MPRLISCAETIPAVLDRTKTETRRLGWWLDRNGRRLVLPGDHLIVCGKVMGRRAGEPLRRLAEVEVTNVRREPLRAITPEGVRAEGVADRWVHAVDRLDACFVRWYCGTFRCRPDTEVTVIEWRYRVSYEGPHAEVAA